MKKFISAVVAMTLAVLALTAPASAAKPKSDANFVLNGSTMSTKIDITLPTKAGFIINPYRISVKVSNEEDSLASEVIAIYGGKGTTDPGDEEAYDTSWKITNNNEFTPVKVRMYAIYKPSRNVQVNAEGDDVDDTKRQLTLDLNVGSVNIPLVRYAPTDWDSEDVGTFTLAKKSGSGDANAANIVLSGSTSNTSGWSSNDTCTLTMAFKFDILPN